MQQGKDFFECKIQNISNVNVLKNNINTVNTTKSTLDEIVQIWKDVCDCEESKFYKENIDDHLKTIEMLKRDINDVKLQNKKLVKENCVIKNQLKILNDRLVERQVESNNEQKSFAVEGMDSASVNAGLQGSSATGSTDHAWLFSTKQWLGKVCEDMNPSTDADNFEKMNNMKDKTSGDCKRDIDCDEDIIQRFETAPYFEEYDEVFEDMEETENSTTYSSTRTSRTRRISDVIDSIGDSPSHTSKEKSPNFCYDVSTIKQQEFLLQSPPRGRPIPTMTDSPSSPPMTPGSDLGYGSTGMPTPPSNALYRPKSFRYSASSVDIAASPPRWDTQLDAKLIGEEDQSTLSNCSNWTKPEAVMPAKKDAREYNMKHSRRGRAVIFNHEDFRDMGPRKGSSVDVTKLTSALSALGFTVEIHNDLEIEQLKTTIGHLAAEDHSDADCLVVTVLTHGLSSGCLMARDYAYPTEHLWTPFTADNCPSLAGKPKIFFIQACRGELVDGGVRLVSRHETDTGTLSYKIPTMADFLLAFSTFQGYYSWRHPETGTWFIQCLCQVLEEEGQKSSLQDILTEVSRRVAVDYESYNDLHMWQHEKKQVPQINSTLLRQVYFWPKD